MFSNYIKNITAVSEPAGAGCRCMAAVIECDRWIKNDSLRMDSFNVTDRTIVNIYGSRTGELSGPGEDGPFIILELSAADEDAALYVIKGRGPGSQVIIRQPHVELRQTGPIQSLDGGLPADSSIVMKNNKIENLVIDDFVQDFFEELPYNLYIPKNYDETQTYPLVLFIHDAGCCGSDPGLTLMQGIGADVWASPEHQRKHPCFVLAPQLGPPPVVNDDFEADERIDIIKRLVEDVAAKYAIDENRIYTTGQSMGCMSSCELIARYPRLFAASMLVAGQWSPQLMASVPEARMWILVSEGDKKAFPGMTAMTMAMEKAGAKVVHETWDAKAGQDVWQASARRMIATGANILFVSFDLETIANGSRSGPGAHHVTTWQVAYEIEAVREWLFSNNRSRGACLCQSS